MTGFLNQVNRARGSNFRAAQNLLSEHFKQTVPASYTLPLQTVPDPSCNMWQEFPRADKTETTIEFLSETLSYADSIVVSVLSASGNSCYRLHEIEWCYSVQLN